MEFANIPVLVPTHSALIVVDVQNDFCPGGSLAVNYGDHVVPVLNSHIRAYLAAGRPVILTRDWHQPNCEHFQKWPPHCVQDTSGAAFHPGLWVPNNVTIISKGMDAVGDAYSGFEGTTDSGQTLDELLKRLKVKMLYVGGLATDYCVSSTAIDGIRHGYEVFVVRPACRAVAPETELSAIDKMMEAGVILLS